MKRFITSSWDTPGRGVEGVIRVEDDACPVGSVSEQSLSPQTIPAFLEPNDFSYFNN